MRTHSLSAAGSSPRGHPGHQYPQAPHLTWDGCLQFGQPAVVVWRGSKSSCDPFPSWANGAPGDLLSSQCLCHFLVAQGAPSYSVGPKTW